MKFTFVTSFYNTEKYIQGLYESLLSQTYTNWDWVVTDDFSDDNTKEKLLEICSKDRKVKYVEQSKKKEMFLHEKILKDVSNFLVQKYFYNYNCFEFCLLSVKLQDYEKKVFYSSNLRT